MKSRICIIGAGQAGLQLAVGLLKNGHSVKLYSDRSARDFRNGPVLSSQCMFDSSLQFERELGLNDWEHQCPAIEGIEFNIAGRQGERALQWSAKFHRPAQSVDQRLKFAGWLERFARSGGQLIIKRASVDDLEQEVRRHDLVIVATGKKELSELFKRNPSASPYDTSQRFLALCYVSGMSPQDDFQKVSFNVISGAGEYFTMPGLTQGGACHYVFFEAIPGGPLDQWDDVRTADEQLQRSLQLLAEYLPWESERCRHVELTDDHAAIRGRITPIVREPVAHLPSGAAVLGMGDTVVLNDPVTGQGSNLASKCAQVYLQSILTAGDRQFDETWMHSTFAAFWDYAQWTTGWTNAMLQPPPDHVMRILTAAAIHPSVAHRFVNAFDNPPDFFPWIADPAEAHRFLQEHAAC